MPSWRNWRRTSGYLPPTKRDRRSTSRCAWTTISGRASVCRSPSKRSSGASAIWSFRKRCNGWRNVSGTRMWGEHLPRRKDLPSKKMPQKPHQRPLRSRHLSRRRSPNLTVRRVPRQKIPPPLMMPHLRVPHRLRLKMHRLFLSGQITSISRKGAHRQERITIPPRWVKPSCGCCIT